jgi:transposase-like protein
VQVNIKNLIDDGQCYQTVRELRWPDGIACPSCQSKQVIKRGVDDTESARQRYECTDCHKRFDDFDRHYFCGTSSASESMGVVSVFHGLEFIE